MRVLQLTGWYAPDSVGGTESYVGALAVGLQRHAIDVVVGAPLIGSVERHYQVHGVSVYRYPISSTPSRQEIRGDVEPRHIDTFRNFVSHWQPDIVHLHSVTRGTNLYHARCVVELEIPLVMTAHVPGVTCPRGTLLRWNKLPCDGKQHIHRCGACMLHSHGVPRVLGWPIASMPREITTLSSRMENRVGSIFGMSAYLRDWIQRSQDLLSLARRIVVLSEWQRMVLVSNGVPVDKLILSRHGLTKPDLVIRERFSTERPLCVSYVGRFDRVKGVHILIEAIRRLPKFDIELRLYGAARTHDSVAYLAELQALADDDRRISFPGELLHDRDWSEMLRSTSVLAVPSLWFETGPLVILEAFAAGIPVIGSRLGGIAELVQHGIDGLLVAPGKVSAWAAVMRRLVEQRDLVPLLAAGIRAVRTNDSVTEDMLHMYGQVLDDPTGMAARVTMTEHAL